MSDFIHVAGWTSPAYNHHPTAHPSLQHLRSYSSATSYSPKGQQNTSPRPLSKSISSSPLERTTMATTLTNGPGLPSRFGSFSDEDGNMSTLPDPRSRAMSPASDNSSQHPDLSNEVATLSNKLINAINHQTNLDDSLSATRHELGTMKERIAILERENQEHKEMVSRGILIRSSVAEVEKMKLRASLAEEKNLRIETEKQKKEIEQELENLTTALFEEANKMVITARESAQQEHELVQRKNDQLKAQLADTESLLKSHQEQLAELKQVMEQMTEEREDQTNQTAPSSPGFSKFDSKDENASDSEAPSTGSVPEPLSPSYPTSFTHLLQTVLRTDLAAYEEFTSLLRMSKNVPVSSRASSGSYGGLSLGLGLSGYASSAAQHGPSNGSTSSLSTSGTHSSPATPTTPASTISTGSTNGPNSLTPLKDTKFYKRALAEDIEPTLRLDNAPSLSWLSKRSVLTAICDGTLVVEPTPAPTRHWNFPCSLCGESRKESAFTRNHRFRTNENENSQRYPLCTYCLGRIRSTCDFLGFLRILKDGHWRADDEESEKAAWEESVRLRENMFWCRMGGGVVPIHHSHSEATRSPRVSQDERKEQETKLTEELELTGEIQPKDITPVPEQVPESVIIPVPVDVSGPSSLLPETAQPLPSSEEAKDVTEVAQGAAQETTQEVAVIIPENDSTKSEIPEVQPTVVEPEKVSEEKHNAARDSVLSSSSLQVSSTEPEKDEVKRLSITIPGSFA